jgi:hypothetical protein
MSGMRASSSDRGALVVWLFHPPNDLLVPGREGFAFTASERAIRDEVLAGVKRTNLVMTG